MKTNGEMGGIGADDRKRRIMILDDHPLVCEGLAALIRQHDGLEVAATCNTVPDAQRALREGLPDLLLLDISMPNASGLDVLKDLLAQYPGLDVLVVSMHDESVYAEHVVRLGAKGYVMKAETSEKIVEAILHVLGGAVYASPNVLSKILARLSAGGHRHGVQSGIDSLAGRELQVYTLIGEGLSAGEIAARLKISPKTVQTHREHIKEKLGLKTAAELNHSAWTWSRNQK